MAKVAAAGALHSSSSNSLHYGGGGSGGGAVKRKTPSELRGEQLKRKNIVELVDGSPAPELGSMRNSNGVICGLKKVDSLKNPRYSSTRMDELFPVIKNSIRLLSKNKNVKESILVGRTDSLKNSSVSSQFSAESQPPISCPKNSIASTAVTKDNTTQAYNTSEKCSESTFRSVTELSEGGEKLSVLSNVDMDNALKGLVSCEPPIFSSSLAESSARIGDFTSGNFCLEFQIPGRKIPLDFTLKTTMRVVCSSSVNWFHRLITCGTYNNMPQFTSGVGCSGDQNMTCLPDLTSNSQVFHTKALHYWVYPQSSLPSSVISALTLSTAKGGQMDFLSKRQLAWEDSFRNLYYMFRKNACNIFYVCTAQFVVMFAGTDGSKETKCVCNAYVSQSTRSLRSMLKEHDVGFSMPLSRSKVEQVTTEDLVELSEIEKQNLGQTRRLGSVSDIDNSPQSLLVFSGNKNVHGLYDFLLNYRVFLTSLTGVDVPLLYSPVPFENAALSAPEVRCKETRRADYPSFPLEEIFPTSEPNQCSSSGFCCIVEIKDTYLPPWIISSICDTMCSNGISFEASFVTETMSVGLNVGLDLVRQELDPKATADENLKESSRSVSIPNTVFSPNLRSACLRGLKYCNGSYTVSLSPV